MQPANTIFYEVLKFPQAELYVIRGGDVSVLARGHLQLFNSKAVDTFLLKLGSVRFALDKGLQVVGTFSDEEKYPAYLIPTFDGFYMIKLLDNTPSVALTNFETVLENTCDFRRRSGMEQKLGDIRESNVDTRFEVLKEAYHKTKDAIVKTMTLTQEQHPNYTLLRTFEDLQAVDDKSVHIADVSKEELERVKVEVDEVVRNHQNNKYWIQFSEWEGTSADEQVRLSKFKTEDLAQRDAPAEAEGLKKFASGPAAGVEHTAGADNIATVKTNHSTEQQEVVGTENQRLPSYEVHSSKDHVEQGLDQASCRLEDAKLYQCCDLPPVEESQVREDTNFTTNLMSSIDSKDKKFEEPVSKNPGQTLDANGDPYRKNLADELSINPPAGSERWGSDVSNPSETTMRLGSELNSDTGFSATSENLGGDFNKEKPLILNTNLTHSQSLTETTLANNTAKDSLSFKQIPSEKNTSKQKSFADQPLNKENATSDYAV